MILHQHESMLPIAILGALSWLAILAGVILFVILAIHVLSRNQVMRNAPATVESPLDTLARRFASGEITAEEFQHSRDLLRGDSPEP
jgi:uncharacterized membrane protein